MKVPVLYVTGASAPGDYPSPVLEEAADVLGELLGALVQSRVKWPDTDDAPDGTGDCGARETYRKIAQASCDRAAAEGRLTFAHVLEESAEALDARSSAELRAELLDVMACSLRRILALDRRGR